MLKSRLDTESMTVQLGIFFSKLGISPNAWTFLSLIPGICGFLSLVSCHDLVKGVGFFMLVGAIDAIDGAVARVTGRATNFGAFLDGVIDRYVEILLYLGLLIYGVNEILIALLIFGSLMPSFVTAYSSYRNVVIEKKDHKRMGGLLERAERLILVYIAMISGIFNPIFLEYVIALVAVLSNFTALQRIWFVWKYKDQ